MSLLKTLKLASLFALPSLTLACSPPPGEGVNETGHSLSLAGSQFEIDDDANLVVDAPGNLDWANVDDTKNDDTPSGQDDNSYKGGSKEDTLCPKIESGSIPNNKSDLKTFGVYEEAGDPGFMHLFWTRVQDPSGTTLMDFEFNQSSTDCGNGVNPVRTVDDLLLEYRLEQGGATAELKARLWNGSNWGPETDLTALNLATGTINNTAIAAADSDGLGDLDERTFGEASVDLSFIFDEGKCVSFGSAFVKSRSSDSFNSALKDFIAPIPINITNCGKVIIRKETDPDALGDSFSFTHNLQTDPASGTTFSLSDGQSREFTDVLFGTGYTVSEDDLGTGLELTGIDCSASTGVTVNVDVPNQQITFDIDEDTDIVDCTFINRAKGDLIIKKVTSDGMGQFDFSSSFGAFSLTTSGPGESGADTQAYNDIDPGTYNVAETIPAGWNLVSATCSDGSPVNAIEVNAGETVTCTFVNERQRGAIKIVKTRNHAADGPGPHPHASVDFLVSGGDIAVPIPVVTNASGEACIDNLLLSSFVGDYTVTEILPSGYTPDGSLEKSVSVTSVASCPNGEQVNFHNIPLTNITVLVDSQIPGGTASTITCETVGPIPTDASGDGSLTLSDLTAGTYNCQVVIAP